MDNFLIILAFVTFIAVCLFIIGVSMGAFGAIVRLPVVEKVGLGFAAVGGIVSIGFAVLLALIMASQKDIEKDEKQPMHTEENF